MALTSAHVNGAEPQQDLAPCVSVGAARGSAHKLAFQVPEPSRIAYAHTFGVRVVHAWWQACTAAHRVRGEARPAPGNLRHTRPLAARGRRLADAFGAAVADLEAEVAAYQIGLLYTGMLPQAQRSKFGVYYTPPCLARRLLDRASSAGVDWRTCRVLDPACGGGAFLAPTARRLLEAAQGSNAESLAREVRDRLRGQEIDPFGAWLSQVALDVVLLPLVGAEAAKAPPSVVICDSLATPVASADFDLVIGNPPYRRIRLDEDARARFARSLYGHANLYGLFTDTALKHARPGGVVAYVTPTSFLAGEYFKNLRGLLGKCAPPASVDFVSARTGVFDDVLQETLLAVYRRGGKKTALRVSELVLATSTDLCVDELGRFDLPEEVSEPWLLPRCTRQAWLARALAAMPHRLQDWGYTVSTGPLVWNRHKGQLSKRAARGRYPLVWAEAITADGRFEWRSERRNHLPYFELGERGEHLLTTQPCVLLQRTTAKEQPRRLIAAVLPEEFLDQHGGAVVENHVNMLRPLSEHPKVSADVLAAFLNSSAADQAFRCLSGSVAVSASELEALPLPPPEALAGLNALMAQRPSAEAIDAECAVLYGPIPP